MSLNSRLTLKRLKFAAHLNALLEDGVGNSKAGEPWTNSGFAKMVTSSRENAATNHVSANSVANWRKGKSLPSEISSIVRAIYGPDKTSSPTARESLRTLFMEAR